MAPRASAGVHVALLRGINVGGRNKLPMARLAELLEAAGAREVETYIQSGNAVFAASAAVARRLPGALARALAAELGADIVVVTRTAAELAAAASAHPLAARGVDEKELHLGFLAERPAPARARALDPDRSPPDAFVLEGRELYLRFPNGVARTRLTTEYLERTLGTACTVRNWRTVQRLRAMAER